MKEMAKNLKPGQTVRRNTKAPVWTVAELRTREADGWLWITDTNGATRYSGSGTGKFEVL